MARAPFFCARQQAVYWSMVPLKIVVKIEA